MQKFIYIKTIIILFIFCFSIYAVDNLVIFPDEIHELENQIVVINTDKPFRVTIDNNCMKVSGVNNLEKRGNKYIKTGDNSYLELDNKCFNGVKVKITIEVESKKIEKIYNILPPLKEERDWGC
ncbi:hypothetical protein DEFDS_1445 [Deferribacter desulfuricans SSM1]|uniref:Uncharacterized protein n=1 Tax=Deferribacter desulfuricans (strain DSM 14783 / JCM 11476 / NBRC 101012 / SSM1) TaxID=639282 RepID=D3PE82_DEFDS|nr:hypothetical protein [Deferribacter desulfuricans]BAI80905.1 hypothetical protein DEFDS_1445 [Deferribacter desulfuricans SSM1]